MANTFITMDMIAKEALMILRNNAVMAGLVHRDYSNDFVAGVGDTITIRKPATFTVKDFVESTGITVQDATEDKQTVKMDKFYDVSFAVTSKDLTMNISDFSAQLLVPAMMAFRDKIDSELIKVAEGATNKVTHAEGLIAPADVIAVRKLLNDGATPLSMRSLVVGTQAEADLLSSELFVSADKVGGTEGLKEASLGRKFGFDTYVDQNVGKKSLAFHKNALALVRVKIRNILSCRCKNGICAKCYGANMATGQPVQVGEAVGIIAAQSIGEPGTQLTMRTFHSGGVAGTDITQGLPRVEELFEARRPKGMATITEIAGTVHIREDKNHQEIDVVSEDGETKSYLITYGSHISVTDGAHVEAGDPLTAGSINPHDLLDVRGIEAVQDYILQEVQRVYRLQGVEISDKHIEVIVRQMMKKVRIESAGDSNFLPGSQVDFLEFEDTNEELEKEGKEPAEGERVLLGITKAALATDSFLSAASFQETTKVLTDAAIKGKVDHLQGLKENVIIGKLIPAGTGMKRYRDIKLNTDYQTKLVDENGEEEELVEAEEAAAAPASDTVDID